MAASSAGAGWSASTFHRPLQHAEISTLRVQVRQRFKPAEEELSGLHAGMRIDELKRLIARRLHISPRQRIVVRHWGKELEDGWTLRQSKLSDRGLVELSVAPRSAEECRILASTAPPTSLLVRPMMGRAHEILELADLHADTTIGDLKAMIWEQRLLEGASKEAVEAARLLFSPQFLTWEVLISSGALDDRLTIVECHLMRDDILYLAPELQAEPPVPVKKKAAKKGAPAAKLKKSARKP